jgi:hypothetical protein
MHILVQTGGMSMVRIRSLCLALNLRKCGRKVKGLVLRSLFHLEMLSHVPLKFKDKHKCYFVSPITRTVNYK